MTNTREPSNASDTSVDERIQRRYDARTPSPSSGRTLDPNGVCNRLYEQGMKKKALLNKVEEGRDDRAPKQQNEQMADEIMDRLYGRSLGNQAYGKERREEVEKSLATFHSSKPPLKWHFSQLSLHDTTSNASYERRSSCHSPSPEEVMNRLYSRSLGHQAHGKERREELEKQATNKKPPVKWHFKDRNRDETLNDFGSKEERTPSDSTSPVEVMDRLYSRSINHQASGKERREQAEKKIMLNNPKPPLKL